MIFIDVYVCGWLVVPALRRHPTTKGTTNVHIAVSEVQFSLFSIRGKLIFTPSRSTYNSRAHAGPYILEEAKSVIRIAFLVGWSCLPCKGTPTTKGMTNAHTAVAEVQFLLFLIW